MTQTHKLVTLNKSKRSLALTKLTNSIYFLFANNFEITISSVCAHSGVSRSFVYKNLEAREIFEKYKTNPQSIISDFDQIAKLKSENESLLNALKTKDAYFELIADSFIKSLLYEINTKETYLKILEEYGHLIYRRKESEKQKNV